MLENHRLPFPNVRSNPDEMALRIHTSAIGILSRRDFTYISPRLHYRVDLLSRDQLNPNGVRGATFRAVLEHPRSGKPIEVIFMLPAEDVRRAQRGGANRMVYVH